MEGTGWFRQAAMLWPHCGQFSGLLVSVQGGDLTDQPRVPPLSRESPPLSELQQHPQQDQGPVMLGTAQTHNDWGPCCARHCTDTYDEDWGPVVPGTAQTQSLP